MAKDINHTALPKLTTTVSPSELFLGNPNATNVMVMYGDYEDAASRAAYLEVKKFMEEYAEDLKFVYRHFPLTKINQKAMKAAEAAEASKEKGKFWEMHHLLMTSPGKLEFTTIVGFSRSLEIYSQAFYSNLINSKFSWEVRANLLSGVESGVKKIPALFINGSYFQEKPTLQYFVKALIDTK